LHQTTDSTATINVHGVGYEVFLPKSSLVNFGKTGEPVTIEVYTHVTQDSLQLFGFLTHLEKKVFHRLISVSGIGPKMALNLISEMPLSRLLKAITQGESDVLTEVSGIGSKTAQRIVVELKDKFKDEVFESLTVATDPRAQHAVPLLRDVASALVNLGYSEMQSRRLIERITVTEEDTVQTLVKKTLGQGMAKGERG
jgi:Holliday junction DNA helicase RuvA